MEWWEYSFDKDLGKILFTKKRFKKTKKECDFLEDVLKLKKGMKILDLGCGVGRHSLELAKRGYEVTGLDYSKDYIEQARKSAKKEKVKLKFIQGDMRKIPFSSKFDILICIWSTFGYFRKESDNLKVLNQIRKCLEPGGKLIIDVMNSSWLRKNIKRKLRTKMGGKTLLQHNVMDKKLITTQWTVFKDKKIIKKFPPFPMYHFNRSSIKKMMDKSGLKVVRYYGDFKKEPCSSENKRMQVVAQKI